jgi:S-adenosylmethionine-diacylglycerol 3-amino-3-carboxypropyl transferase
VIESQSPVACCASLELAGDTSAMSTNVALDRSAALPVNHRLRSAVHRHKAASRQGLQERLFTLLFSGLVYPQIWEDPLIDLEAMQLQPGEHVVAIASGGCNVLSYVTAADVRVTAIDLNAAHIALNKLKLAAARRLPDYAALRRFFAEPHAGANLAAYRTHLRPHLDEATRRYWDGRDALGRRRIAYFGRNVYRRGLLGAFITSGHWLARVHGRDPRKLLEATSLADQRRIYESELAPLFARRHIRWLLDRPAALFGLGIPPSQFTALKGDEPTMASVLEQRLQRLACDFPLAQNYFAWQAFGQRYAGADGPLPPYLQRERFHALRARAQNVAVTHASFTEHLAGLPAASRDAYVLLDAQDWMTDAQLTALWREILRTARPGARVIFRTAGEVTILPGRVPAAILSRFAYDAEAGRAWTARDRSAIYGGFHLYTLTA